MGDERSVGWRGSLGWGVLLVVGMVFFSLEVGSSEPLSDWEFPGTPWNFPISPAEKWGYETPDRVAWDTAALEVRRTLQEIRGLEGVLGSNHPRLLMPLVQMARLLRAAGQGAQATGYYQQALEVALKHPGPLHAVRREIFHALAGLMAESDDWLGAIDYLSRALALSEYLWGSAHPDQKVLLEELARCHGKAGQTASQEAILKRLEQWEGERKR